MKTVSSRPPYPSQQSTYLLSTLAVSTHLDVEHGVGLADVLVSLEGDLLLVERVHVEGVRHDLLVDPPRPLRPQHAADLPRRVKCLANAQKRTYGQYNNVHAYSIGNGVGRSDAGHYNLSWIGVLLLFEVHFV